MYNLNWDICIYFLIVVIFRILDLIFYNVIIYLIVMVCKNFNIKYVESRINGEDLCFIIYVVDVGGLI